MSSTRTIFTSWRCSRPRSALTWPGQSRRTPKGRNHLVTIDVEGLPDDAAPARVAKAVADSPLVKTAIYGADPNWGRIVSAAGYAGVPFDERGRVALARRLAALPRRAPPCRSTRRRRRPI